MRGPCTAALALLVLAPGCLGADPKLPGAYPDELDVFAQALVDGAPADVWPPGRGVHPDAKVYLDEAARALDEGRVSGAIDLVHVFQVENAVLHVLDDIEDMSTSDARAHVRNITSNLAAEGRALATAGRATVNALDVGALTLPGGEAAVLGALFIARGELQLNLFDEVRAHALSETGAVDANVTGAVLQASLGGVTAIAAGTSLASLAPAIHGDELADGVLDARLEEVARTRVTLSGPPEVLDNLPRGNTTRDNSVLRAGLLLLAAEELRALEIRKTYLSAEGVDLVPHIMEGLAYDKDHLRAYAAAGSPLALSAYETVDLDRKTVGNALLEQVTKVRGFAQSVTAAEEIVRPGVGSG